MRYNNDALIAKLAKTNETLSILLAKFSDLQDEIDARLVRPCKYGVCIYAHEGKFTLYYPTQYMAHKVRQVMRAWQGKGSRKELEHIANIIAG